MRIFVKSLISKPLVLIVSPNSTIGKIKANLWAYDGANIDHYFLSYNGKKLENTHTLRDYDIQDEESIFRSFKLNGGGAAISGISVTTNTAKSIQHANSTIAQQFTGICNIQCIAITDNASVVIIDSNVEGGITINNECSLDATCGINSTMTSTNEAAFEYFGVQGGADLTPGFLAVTYSAVGVTTNNVYTEQKINLSTTQTVYQECNLISEASLSNVTIFAQNSNITGGITINNSASTGGGCTLDSSLGANSAATGLTQSKQHGNTTKAAKKGDGKNKTALWTWIIIITGVIIIAYMIIASTKSKKEKDAEAEMYKLEYGDASKQPYSPPQPYPNAYPPSQPYPNAYPPPQPSQYPNAYPPPQQSPPQQPPVIRQAPKPSLSRSLPKVKPSLPEAAPEVAEAAPEVAEAAPEVAEAAPSRSST